MENVGRVIGGLLAVAGGALLIIIAIFNIHPTLAKYVLGQQGKGVMGYVQAGTTLWMGILGALGGTLLCLVKNKGVVVLGAILAIVGGLIAFIGTFLPIWWYGPIYLTTNFFPLWIDPTLAMVGGVVGMIFGLKA